MVLVVALISCPGCLWVDRGMGCMEYGNVYCNGRWVCDIDPADNCEICECMAFWGPGGEQPWQTGYPGYY
jgi:hypothetical protein